MDILLKLVGSCHSFWCAGYIALNLWIICACICVIICLICSIYVNSLLHELILRTIYNDERVCNCAYIKLQMSLFDSCGPFGCCMRSFYESFWMDNYGYEQVFIQVRVSTWYLEVGTFCWFKEMGNGKATSNNLSLQVNFFK